MKALRKIGTAGLALAMMASLGGTAFAVQTGAGEASLKDGSKGTPGIEQFGDIRHVAHIGGWIGSDLEFASRMVVKLDGGATGDPVCETDANGDCLVDENGETIFQMERRDFALAGGYNGHFGRVIDVTDPENPVLVDILPCNLSQGDIQIHEDLLFIAADGGSRNCQVEGGGNSGPINATAILDFSDPRNATYLSKISYGRGSHNHTVHPSGDYIYLSDSDVASAGLGNVPIWDISDPASPKIVTEFKYLAHSPHDITFSADGSRAYVAAVSASYILDTTDPEAPAIVSTIANEGITISHQADPTPDGKFLLVSDEVGGGAAGISPSGPVHVYSLADERAPVKLGVIWNNCVQETCQSLEPSISPVGVNTPISTAHVFRINPDGYTMAIAWYKDGIFVIDFSDIGGANLLGSGAASGAFGRVIAGMKMPGANSWAAKMWQERHPGYVFANGQGRGFDIFHVPELGGDFYATGSIRAGAPHTSAAGSAAEHEFATAGGCNGGRPTAQGVDGYVYADIPEEFGDGEHQITLDVKVGAAADLTIWYYNSSCSLMSTSAATSGSLIPEGAEHIVVNAFTGGSVRFNTYIG